jgi:hypothetical protein
MAENVMRYGVLVDFHAARQDGGGTMPVGGWYQERANAPAAPGGCAGQVTWNARGSKLQGLCG